MPSPRRWNRLVSCARGHGLCHAGPCCHWGRTPPCTDALVQRGVARVGIATRDPDPRVDGAGIARLRSAGIEVEEGGAGRRPTKWWRVSGCECGRAAPGDVEAGLHPGWPHRHAIRRKPLDHRPGGGSRCACPTGRHDAAMVGVGTVLADNPG